MTDPWCSCCMQTDISWSDACKVPVPEFSLPETVSNIVAQRLRVAKARGDKIKKRIVKMAGRGWTIQPPEEDVVYIPSRGTSCARRCELTGQAYAILHIPVVIAI